MVSNLSVRVTVRDSRPSRRLTRHFLSRVKSLMGVLTANTSRLFSPARRGGRFSLVFLTPKEQQPSEVAYNSKMNDDIKNGYFCRRAALSREFRRKLEMLASILLSGLPFVVFLFFYSINKYVRILPTSDQSHSVRLHNVSAWESAVLPFSLSKLLSSHHCVPLDFLSAVPYLAHYAIPIAYPLLLLIYERDDCVRRFYLLLGASVWTIYVFWYLLPTAPPWFYQLETGPGNRTTVYKEGEAFARLDKLTGVGFFRSMFANNPVPFAAFPSGHVAWPMCIMLTIPSSRRWWFAGYVALVAWATMYTGHHYLADVVSAIVIVLVVDVVRKRREASQQQRCSSEKPPTAEECASLV